MKRLSASALALILLLAGGTPLPAGASSRTIASGQIVNVSLNDRALADKNDKDESQKTSNLQTAQSIDNKTPELKSDLPKMDQTKPEPPAQKRHPLKGSVQHQEVIKNSHNHSEGGNGQFDGNANKGPIRGRLGTNKPRDPNELGLGIIGVKFVMGFGRAPIIYEVFPGTPAAEAGIRVRDIIIAVDGIPTTGLSKEEVYNIIVGQPNTNVTLSIRHNTDFQVHTLTRMDLNKIADPMLRRDYLRM